MSDDVLNRIPPQDLQAEQAAIGSMLLEKWAIERAVETVVEEDFFRETHRLAFRGIKALYDAGEPVDMITLGTWLQQRELLEIVGGTHYLQVMMAQTPTAAGVAHYAQIVADKSLRRGLIRQASTIIEHAYTAEDIAEEIPGYQKFLDLTQSGLTQDDGKQLWEVELDAVQSWQESDALGVEAGVQFELAPLRRILDPLLPGEVLVVAGRPSMGKSLASLQMAKEAAAQGKHVIFLSLEMSNRSLGKRSVVASSETPGNLTKMLEYRKNHAAEIYPDLIRAIEKHKGWDCKISRRRYLDANGIKSLGKRKQVIDGLDLVVVDYLQLMASNEKVRDAYERVSAISREVHEAAEYLHCPIILVSQLSRNVESRVPRVPMMSDLRESGAIEQDADSIMLVYRPGYYGANECAHKDVNIAPLYENGAATVNLGATLLIVAKQRNGSTGSAWVHAELEKSRIVERA